MLVAVPLREDVDSPWLEESDEQEWKDEETSVPFIYEPELPTK